MLVFDSEKNKRPYIEVYRIENKNKKGCYVNNLLTWSDSSKPVRPNVFTDSFTEKEKILFQRYINYKEKFNYDFLFGFIDLNQLFNWFLKKELENLKNEGFNIVKRKAIKVYTSKNQCFFIPYNERKVNNDKK